MLSVAINGFGRIGRAAFRIMLDDASGLQVVAINDLVPVDNLAYLLRYDTVYGRYGKTVAAGDGKLIVDGTDYPVYCERDPADLPWAEHEVDVVLECTGVFSTQEQLQKHLEAGAKYAILSAPAKGDDVPTIVHGVNSPRSESLRIISCASCTTNCITPVMEVLNRRIGVLKATMTTIHAYTSTQSIVDGPNRKTRRGRAAAANFVPTTTGAAIATTKALPDLEGRFDGVAVRGPVVVGSLADIVCLAARETDVEEVNGIFSEEAASPKYQGVLGVSEDPIVSSDIIGDTRASIVDLGMTQVVDGDLIKVMSWYDNEWGFTNQMIREVLRLAEQAPDL